MIIGKVTPERAQAALELQTVDPRHTDIADDAARLQARQGLEKCGSGFVGPHRQAGGGQRERQGLAHAIVIIDEVDHGVSRHLPAPRSRI